MIISSDQPIIFESILLSNNTTINYSGLKLTFVAGDNFTFGDIGYVRNGIVYKFTESNENEDYFYDYQIVLCLQENILKGSSSLFLLDGIIKKTSWNFTAVLNSDRLLYCSLKDNVINSNQYLKYDYLEYKHICIGSALTSDTFLFQPMYLLNRVNRTNLVNYKFNKFSDFGYGIFKESDDIILTLDKCNIVPSFDMYPSNDYNNTYSDEFAAFAFTGYDIQISVTPDFSWMYRQQYVYSNSLSINILDIFPSAHFINDKVYYVKITLYDSFENEYICQYKFVVTDDVSTRFTDNIYGISADYRKINTDDYSLVLFNSILSNDETYENIPFPTLKLYKNRESNGPGSIFSEFNINTDYLIHHGTVKFISDTRALVSIKYIRDPKSNIDPNSWEIIIYLISWPILSILDQFILSSVSSNYNIYLQTYINPRFSHPYQFNADPDYYASEFLILDDNKYLFYNSDPATNGDLWCISLSNDSLVVNRIEKYLTTAQSRYTRLAIISPTKIAFHGIRMATGPLFQPVVGTFDIDFTNHTISNYAFKALLSSPAPITDSFHCLNITVMKQFDFDPDSVFVICGFLREYTSSTNSLYDMCGIPCILKLSDISQSTIFFDKNAFQENEGLLSSPYYSIFNLKTIKSLDNFILYAYYLYNINGGGIETVLKVEACTISPNYDSEWRCDDIIQDVMYEFYTLLTCNNYINDFCFLDNICGFFAYVDNLKNRSIAFHTPKP